MVTLKDAKIVESWGVMLEGCQGEEQGLFRATEVYLEESKAPGVTWKRETVTPGWLKGLMGKKRDFLLIEHERFDDYSFFVSVRDYGRHLDVNWYLAASQKNPLVKLATQAAGFIPGSALFNLDVFDQEDLRAYGRIGQAAVKRGTESVIERRNVQIQVDWKSKGMLAL